MRRCAYGFVCGVVLLCVSHRAFAGEGIAISELVNRHLDSIGSADARKVQSRVVEGTAIYRLLVGGSGQIYGKSVFASQGEKTRILLKINGDRYHGEQFIFNGAKTDIAGTYADKTRSEFGEFLRGQDAPLREGLLGGVLNTSWPLLDTTAHKASLSYEGLKKVEGHEVEVVRYKPRKSSDLTIVLYFDPTTYRHLRTLYSVSRAPGMASEVENARRHEAYYRIEERFSDFQTTDGLTLPATYDLRFTEELENGFSKSIEWEVHTSRVMNNIVLDPRNFDVP